jgi:hypothetical protein
VFEPRGFRSAHHLVDVAQTLQLTKSKRVRVERQTTFERPANGAPVEETIQIRAFDPETRLSAALDSSVAVDVDHLHDKTRPDDSLESATVARRRQSRPCHSYR